MGEYIAYKDFFDVTKQKYPNLSFYDSLLPFIIIQFHLNFGGGISLRLNSTIKSSIILYPKEYFEHRIKLDSQRLCVSNWIYSNSVQNGQLFSSFASIQSRFSNEVRYIFYFDTLGVSLPT